MVLSDKIKTLDHLVLPPQPSLLVADIPIANHVAEEVEEDIEVVMKMLRASLHSKKDDQFETVDVALLKKAVKGGMRVYSLSTKANIGTGEKLRLIWKILTDILIVLNIDIQILNIIHVVKDTSFHPVFF